jgi:hypothetical protein
MSAAFPLPLDVRNFADGSRDHYMLLSPFVFIDEDRVYVTPAGFRTDFASVPRVCQGIIDATNLVAPGSIPHDWLYATRGLVVPGQPRISREQADHVLLHACLANGMPEVEAMIIFEAVRIGGQSAWDEGESPEALLTLDLYTEMSQRYSSEGPEVLA